jgi:hypothetical protein
MGFLSAFNKKPVDGRVQPVERLSALIAAYLQRLETKGGTIEERSLTLIARSPSAAVAQALALQAKGLEREQVSPRLIFARLAPVEMLAELAATLNLIGPRDSKSACVRMIKTPALLHAHEQLVLGCHSCWTGDTLRRCEANRNGLDLWEEDSLGSVNIAQLAFNAIWAIAKPVPARFFAGGSRVASARASLTPAMAAAGLASDGGLRPTPVSPLTRH